MAGIPKHMIRESDGAVFVLDGEFYYLQASYLKWPDNLHHKYSYECLESHGFLPNNEEKLPDYIPELYEAYLKRVEKNKQENLWRGKMPNSYHQF